MAKGGAIQIIGQLTQGVVALLFVAIMVRLLGADDYGLFRQVAQILAVAAQLGLAGFNHAALRFIARARASNSPGEVRGVAWTASIGALAGSGLVFIAIQIGAGSLATRFADTEASRSELAASLRLGAAFVPLFALTQVLRYCMQAYKTMVSSVVVGNIVQPLVRLVIASGLVAFGFGAIGAVGGMVVASAVALAVAGRLFSRMSRPSERTSRALIQPGPMTRFALLQGGSSILGVQTLGLSILILGLYGTDSDVGLLGIAIALQTPGTLFLGGIVNIWAPVVTDLYERGATDRLAMLYRMITRWVITFSFPIFAALIVVPNLFVDLLGGGHGGEAAALVAVLAVGNLFYTGTGPTGLVLSMTGHPGVNLANSVVAVAMYVGLGAWVVPRHGALGMVAVDAIVTAVINSARVVEAKVLVGIHPFGRSLFKPLSATIVALIPLVGISVISASWTMDVSALAIGSITYVLMLKSLGLDPEERQVIDEIRRRLRAALPSSGFFRRPQ